MPALRQFFTMLSERRNARHLASSEKPFAGAKPFITSPLSPPIEYRQSDHITPPDSALSSNFTDKRHAQQEIDKEDNPSPTLSIASRLGHMSSTPVSPTLSIVSRLERLHGAKDGHKEQTVRYKKKWEERRASRPTLGNPAVLGYSCDISSPKFAT